MPSAERTNGRRARLGSSSRGSATASVRTARAGRGELPSTGAAATPLEPFGDSASATPSQSVVATAARAGPGRDGRTFAIAVRMVPTPLPAVAAARAPTPEIADAT